MKKEIYRSVLKKAWEITKKCKYLWFFAFFAALLGNGGEYQIILKLFEQIGARQYFPVTSGVTHPAGSFFGNLYQTLSYSPKIFFLALISGTLILIFIGLVVWLIIISQILLIRGIGRHISGKKNDILGSIKFGKEKFIPILSINVISKFLILIFLGLIELPLASFLFTDIYRTKIIDKIFYILIFLAFISLSIIVSFVARYACAYVVLKNKELGESIKLGWELFVKNWVVSLEIALILFLINSAIGLLMMFIIMRIVLPLLLIMAISSSMFGLYWVAGGIAILMSLLSLAALGVIGIMIAMFQWASWIVLFEELTAREKILSKIDRSIKIFSFWIREQLGRIG